MLCIASVPAAICFAKVVAANNLCVQVFEFVFVFVFEFEFVHLSSNNLDNQASPFQGWTPGARIGRARPRWQRGQRAGRSGSDQNYQRSGRSGERSWLSEVWSGLDQNKKKHIFGMVDISDIFQKVKTKKRASGKPRFEKRRLSLNLRWEWKWWTPIICAKLRMLWLYSVFSKSCRFDAQESKWQICWMMMTRVRQQ